jgi:carboxyl-terminal processing protease
MNACTYGQERALPRQGTPNSNELALQKMNIAFEAIRRLYVDTVNTTQLASDVVIHMLEKLDPHSVYMTAEEVRDANASLQGNFDGIGIQFSLLTDTVYISQVIADGPSEKIGLLAGDKIIYVNDTLIAGVNMRNNDIVSRLRGPRGTSVDIKVLRRGQRELLNFTIIRDRIPVNSISAAYMIDELTGYIKLIRFAEPTYREFIEALEKLKTQGMQNLILDLQDNGGGYLQAAVEISSEFLNSGSLIVYTEGANQRREEAHSSGSGSMRNGKLVILVDEISASASEIVSGAVQDWDRGVIVGRRTYGKGLVQRPIPLPDGSLIRLTTAHYHTPTGRSIQKPYTAGDRESYHRELIERLNRREMISADSTHFPESLKYSTLVNNRTVYGGGGIMPDYFVPVDTTKISYVAPRKNQFYIELSSKYIPLRYARTLVEENRERYQAQYPDFDLFKRNFAVTDNMLNNMLDMYRKEKAEELKEDVYQLTEEQQQDLEKVKAFLLQLIKIYIIQEMYGDANSFQLWNPLLNDAYNKAIEIISNEQEYNRLLSQGRSY